MLRTPLPAPSTLGIPQDTIIFAMIMIAFLVYITLKGELTTYMGFFSPGKSSSGSSNTARVNTSPDNPLGNIPSGVSGVPGVSSNPFQGLPSSTGTGSGGFWGGGPSWFNKLLGGQ